MNLVLLVPGGRARDTGLDIRVDRFAELQDEVVTADEFLERGGLKAAELLMQDRYKCHLGRFRHHDPWCTSEGLGWWSKKDVFRGQVDAMTMFQVAPQPDFVASPLRCSAVPQVMS